MVNRKSIASKILHGNLRTAIFAVTSACNYKCKMCDMHKQEPRFIDLEDAKKILHFLNDNKFLIAYFTGGEPTLHPNISDMIEHANNLGLVTSLTTNGTVSRKKLEELKDAGLYMFSVSLDHYKPDVCTEVRSVKRAFDKAVATITYAKELGMRVFALTYLNPQFLENNDGLERMVEYVTEELGVPFGFCYPTRTTTTTYRLGGTKRIGNAQKKTIVMNKILKMKRNGVPIVNPVSYIEDVIKFNEGKVVEYTCKGGEDVCYIDWFGDFYPCFIKKKIFNILRDRPKILTGVKCNECLINCFREPSILPQMFSFKHGLKEIAKKLIYKTSLSTYF